MAGEAREKCAVAGVYMDEGVTDAAPFVYESLFALQHRGVEASGIVASDARKGSFEEHRGRGLVRDVYNKPAMASLTGQLAIGHNRYSTSGLKHGHFQPVIDQDIGLALAQNGNIPDTSPLEETLSAHNFRLKYANDTEKVGMALSQKIRQGSSLPEAIEEVYPKLTGAFSFVGLHDDTLVAFRDRHGIRPLALGQFDGNYVVASETCGLDILGADYVREIEPGEMVTIANNELQAQQLAEGEHKLDIFEFVYFARHDSELYGKSVNEVRRDFGRQLASEHPPLVNNADNTIVIPVPDTSIPEAKGYARTLGLYEEQLIIKNRFIGRTFMQPTQMERQQQLQRKHNYIKKDIYDKDIILVDDSIIRLNTIPRLVERAKQLGAKSVSVLIGSPPVRFPDFYGIDIPDQSELAAANLTIEEMQQKIGADYLGFLSLSGMIKATGMPRDKFNLSCFTGEYPAEIGKSARKITTPTSLECID